MRLRKVTGVFDKWSDNRFETGQFEDKNAPLHYMERGYPKNRLHLLLNGALKNELYKIKQ